MNYHKQTRNACMAYSLLQLGRVSKQAVKEYEKLLEKNGHRADIDSVGGWLEKYAPEVKDAWKNKGSLLNTEPVPKSGRGVAIVMGESPWTRCWHAVSFEDGKMLDSDADVGHTETLDEVKKRWQQSGYQDVKFVSLFPVKG